MKKFYVLVFLSFFLFSSCKKVEVKKSEEDKIKEVCSKFMSGRRALENGQTTTLKSVTEDSLYKLIVLNQQYVQMLQTSVIKADLNIVPTLVEIKGNTATCKMSGMEFYVIHLYKTKNDWKVNGENGIFANTAMIAASQKKIDDYKIYLKKKPKLDAVLKVVNQFFLDARLYFKNGDSEVLKNNCTDDTVDFMQRLCSYAKKRSGEKTLIEEMEKPNPMVGDIEFDGDKAIFKFYGEDIFLLLQKIDNSYKISGFNKINSKNINQQIITNQYLDLLRASKFIRQKQYIDKSIN